MIKQLDNDDLINLLRGWLAGNTYPYKDNLDGEHILVKNGNVVEIDLEYLGYGYMWRKGYLESLSKHQLNLLYINLK